MKKIRLNFIHLNFTIYFIFHLALDIKMAEVFDKYYSIQIASHSLSQYLKETKIYKEDIDTIDNKLNDTILISFVKKLLLRSFCVLKNTILRIRLVF